jgi:hypothetical protein
MVVTDRFINKHGRDKKDRSEIVFLNLILEALLGKDICMASFHA